MDSDAWVESWGGLRHFIEEKRGCQGLCIVSACWDDLFYLWLGWWWGDAHLELLLGRN